MHVALIGTGLIGGSLGLALRSRGHRVVAFDVDPTRAARALGMGAADEVVDDPVRAVAGCDLAVVATPVGRIGPTVVATLEAGAPVVTDVGSVKGPVVREVATHGRAAHFVGGHPMAGSEQDGLDGADADLFVGATWVLTPVAGTDPDAHATVRALATTVGAEVVEIPPDEHDALVAVVSHVPQLAATTLMDVAAAGGEGSALLLRLAAGGFRDMTRIAASHPAIWPDICAANRDAIIEALDRYVEALAAVRRMVDAGDRDDLLALLERARGARRDLPVSAAVAGPLVELRIPVPDRPGVLAEVTTLAGSLGVNIVDLEINHSIEGTSGLLVLIVGAARADALAEGLVAAGYHPVRSDL
ncbi:MAG: prephenate dehydrogenase/arogenate dehydrogenase family protein [Actinomycetes bacterium]